MDYKKRQISKTNADRVHDRYIEVRTFQPQTLNCQD